MSIDDPTRELTQEERERLEGHLDAIETVQVAPLRDGPDRGYPGVADAVRVIDTLALSYSRKGNKADRWSRFAVEYLPDIPTVSKWYGELRSSVLHNSSAGEGLRFIQGDEHRARHGQVISGATVVHTGQLITDTVSAFDRYRSDVFAIPGLALRALEHFDKHSPVREKEIAWPEGGSVTASAASSAALYIREPDAPPRHT